MINIVNSLKKKKDFYVLWKIKVKENQEKTNLEKLKGIKRERETSIKEITKKRYHHKKTII